MALHSFNEKRDINRETIILAVKGYIALRCTIVTWYLKRCSDGVQDFLPSIRNRILSSQICIKGTVSSKKKKINFWSWLLVRDECMN